MDLIFNAAKVVAARKVSEDSQFMLVEIVKDNTRGLTIIESDELFTMFFMRVANKGTPDAHIETFRPWEDE